MIGFYIVLAIAIVMSLTFVFSWSKDRPLISFWLKGLATVSVIALGIYAVLVSDFCSTSQVLFIIGLALCMLGDLTLALLELLDESKKEQIITLGMIAFGMAQVVFVVGMSIIAGFMPFAILGGLGFAGIVYLMRKPMGLDFGKCIVPGLIYSTALATSLCSAITYMVVSGFALAGIILTIGFAMFMISDLILSQIYFAKGEHKALYIPNLLTYYAAIILIAVSMIALI